MVEFNQSSKDQPNYLQGFGGDTSNFCIAAARQGATTGFVSAVGDDHFGRLLLDLWQCESVDTSMVQASTATRRPASISSRTARTDTSSIICARVRPRAAMRRTICRSTRLQPRKVAASVRHQSRDQRERLRRGARRDRPCARKRRASEFRHQSAPEAVAARAGARGDARSDSPYRHLPAELGRRHRA